jgi:hypothetical protein
MAFWECSQVPADDGCRRGAGDVVWRVTGAVGGCIGAWGVETWRRGWAVCGAVRCHLSHGQAHLEPSSRMGLDGKGGRGTCDPPWLLPTRM